MEEKFQNRKKPIAEIDFAELQDGSLADVIQDALDPSKSRWAVYKNGVVEQMQEVRDGRRILTPVPRRDPALKYVRLPRAAEPFISVNHLFAFVYHILKYCIDTEPHWLALMALFGMSTWFPERTPAAPYLALVGPPGSGKTTAMRCLSLVCRRSLLSADITSAGFFDVCERMRPTLFIDETLTAGYRPTLFHLLRSSNSPGFVSLRKNRAQVAFGPKVLAWLELPNDPALNSRCIIVPMQRSTRTDLKSPDDPKVMRVADTIQMRLLQFRLEYFNKLVPPKIPDGVKLSGRLLDLYRALGLPIGEDEELCTQLAHAIAGQRQFHSCLLSAPQASMVRVLFGSIHAAPNDGGYWLSDLTCSMNSDLSSHGEPARLKERQAGNILTSLGLTNRTRRNTGYYLWLDRADRQRIHQHVLDYEINTIASASSSKCDLCVQQEEAAFRTDTSAVPVTEQAGSDRPKRARGVRGVRRVRRPADGIPLPVGSPQRSHQT